MKQNWLIILGIGLIMMSHTVGAVEYSADKIEKKEGIFYVKETQKPLTGTLIRTYPDGTKMAESVFVDGILNGESRGFGSDGKLAHTIQYKNRKKEGVMRQYDEQGIMRIESNYKDDRLHGEARLFYPSQKVQLLETYKAGVLDGNRIEYYENGQVAKQMNYTNNQLNGVAKEFYENGQVKSVLPFENGRKNGKTESFFSNGKPQFAMNFKNDVLDGENLRYDETGKLTDKRLYKDGMVVSGMTLVDGKETPLTVEQIDELNSKAKLHTPENTYKEKDKLYDKTTKKVVSGIFRIVNSKGVIIEEYEFWKGLPHGAAQLFDEKGHLTQQVFFEKGRKVGYRMMDETGRVIKTCAVDEKGVETCQ